MSALALIDAEIGRLHTRLDELRIARRVVAELGGVVTVAEVREETALEPPKDEPVCVVDISRAPGLQELIAEAAAPVDLKVNLRPAYVPPEGPGAELACRVREEIQRRGISVSAASREMFGNAAQLYQLHHGRPKDVARAKAWLGEEPPAPPPEPARRASLGFEAQLERVSRGEVGIAPAFHPRKQIDGTLGGVTGEIL